MTWYEQLFSVVVDLLYVELNFPDPLGTVTPLDILVFLGALYLLIEFLNGLFGNGGAVDDD